MGLVGVRGGAFRHPSSMPPPTAEHPAQRLRKTSKRVAAAPPFSGSGAVCLGTIGSHRVPPATRAPPDASDLGAGIGAGSRTGLSTLKSCPVQSQPLACTGSVAMNARASTEPTITLIFDVMGCLLLRNPYPCTMASQSSCHCDGLHRKDNFATSPASRWCLPECPLACDAWSTTAWTGRVAIALFASEGPSALCEGFEAAAPAARGVPSFAEGRTQSISGPNRPRGWLSCPPAAVPACSANPPSN